MAFLSLLLAQGAGAAPPSQQPAAVVIDEVELSGVTVLTQKEIEVLLDTGPGEVLERLKVFRTAENLKNAYSERGYELMTIQSRVFRRAKDDKTILEFTVTEGLPTRIAGVKFVPGELRTASSRREWESKSDLFASKFGVQPGDPNDRGKLAAGRGALTGVLASDEYIGAKVVDVRASEAEAPESLRSLQAAKWIQLEVVLDIGERVSFGFRGNQALSGARLNELVESQRLLGLGKTYITDIRTTLLEQYRAIGYGLAQITYLTFELSEDRGRHVTYLINEGPRVALDSIAFDGNGVFTEEQLRVQFLSRAPLSVRNGYYVEADIEKAANLLVEWIQSQGFLVAKLVAVHSNFLPQKRERKDRAQVRAVVYLYEGDRTMVGKIDIEGNKAITSERILEILGASQGGPLNLFAFTEGLESLKAAYRERGYLGIRILNEATSKVIVYGNENRTATIDLQIDEGPQYRASQILIEGNTTTHLEVIQREIELKEGDILAESRVLEIETRLRRLGIFSGVAVRLIDDPAKADHKILRVVVQEADRGVYDYGFGGRNDLGVRVFGSIGYTNLFGRNHSLSLRGNANQRVLKINEEMISDTAGGIPPEYNAQLAYLWPWFLWGDTTFRPTFTVSSTQYRTFNAVRVSGAMTWEKKVSKPLGMTASLNWSWDFVSQTQARSDEDEQDLTIGALTPSLEIDLRDNPLSPTRGFFAEGSLEVAAPFLGSSAFRRPTETLRNGELLPVGYYRVQLRGDYHLPLPLGLGLYLSFRTGFERQNEAGGYIPLIKQFALGGAGSLRGFLPQEVNQSALLIRGTASFVNYRAQLDFPVAGAKLGPFVDVANLLQDAFPLTADYYMKDLNVGAGFGLRFPTPIGPVNFDLGFKLRGPAGGEPYRLDFSIGII